MSGRVREILREISLQVLANTKAKAKEVEGKLKEADERTRRAAEMGQVASSCSVPNHLGISIHDAALFKRRNWR